LKLWRIEGRVEASTTGVCREEVGRCHVSELNRLLTTEWLICSVLFNFTSFIGWAWAS